MNKYNALPGSDLTKVKLTVKKKNSTSDFNDKLLYFYALKKRSYRMDL